MWVLIISLLLLAFVIYLIALSLPQKKSTKKCATSTNSTPPTQCSSQKTACNECAHTICQCAEVDPVQSKCPKCPNGALKNSANDVKACDTCERNFRCPGCAL